MPRSRSWSMTLRGRPALRLSVSGSGRCGAPSRVGVADRLAERGARGGPWEERQQEARRADEPGRGVTGGCEDLHVRLQPARPELRLRPVRSAPLGDSHPRDALHRDRQRGVRAQVSPHVRLQLRWHAGAGEPRVRGRRRDAERACRLQGRRRVEPTDVRSRHARRGIVERRPRGTEAYCRSAAAVRDRLVDLRAERFYPASAKSMSTSCICALSVCPLRASNVNSASTMCPL